jgi:hypothetical protein
MRRVFLAIAALAAAATGPPDLAVGEIVRSETTLANRTICWWSGQDSEQYLGDHTYVYSYHVHVWTPYQYVVRGRWSIGRDGVVTLTMEGGAVQTRKYDIRGDHVVELTGTLDGGAEGYFC